jgi:predicted dienelactone hydrolase
MTSNQPKSGAQVELPAPTGSFAVGRIAYHWIDSLRAEPFSAKEGVYREMIVYVWYPAQVQPNTATATYFPNFEAIEKSVGEKKMKNLFGSGYSATKSGKLRTHTFENAEMHPSSRQYPVLVFSPGFGEYSLTYTAMLEDLASHGYVVAAIDHPYDAGCVVFSDGRSIPFAQDKWDAAKTQPNGIMEYYGARIEVWTADTRFVLDQLLRYGKTPHLRAPFAGRLDLQRIGIFGHSVGGMTAARVCELDARFHACMNQDSDYRGNPFMPISSAQNIKQPFLFFVSEHSFFKHLPLPTDQQLVAQKLTRAEFDSIIQAYDKNQEEALAKMPGGSYRVAVETPGFTHRSFMDLRLLGHSDDPTEVVQHLKNLEIVRSYTRAFFDKYLMEQKDTLLDDNVATVGFGSEVTVDRFGPASK